MDADQYVKTLLIDTDSIEHQAAIEIWNERKEILTEQIDRLNAGKGFCFSTPEKQIAHWNNEILKCDYEIKKLKIRKEGE